jgi:sialate O-acetylesterase
MAMRSIIITLLLIASGNQVFAQLKLARLFSDHAVLQRQKPLPVWGWAKPDETISVSLAGQTLKTQANTEGAWRVIFQSFEAGGPYKMTVSATTETLTIEDILMGDVWLCSGQSNMEWAVASSDNFLKERKNANFPQIRHFRVEHEVTLQPEKNLKTGDWKICQPETVGGFTAIGFFFAREIYQKLNVPIGILHSSWGGSQVEGWISKEAMLSSNELKDYAQNLPTTWEEADMRLANTVKAKVLGNPNANPSIEDERKYLQADFDFSKWYTADPMGQWDWKGIWAWRGNGFMAKMVEIPSEMTGQITTLGLAEHFSYNEIYINGKPVSVGLLRGGRKILVPANTWKAGMNKLMVKMNKAIEPEWYGLGLMGSSTDLFVSNETQTISLAGNDWKLMPSFSEPYEFAHLSNNVGVSIYNAMIAPLVPYAIKGALWYQGESNAGRAFQYRKTFPLMIEDWRKKWNDEFPFYFVQLAAYGSNQNSNQGSNWAELREAQTMTLKLPKTGMAVTTDVGNANDIHPTNKQDVAKRLAANALKTTYNQDVLHSSPMYKSVSFDKEKAIVTFDFTGKGLMVKDKFGYLKGFEIAGEDHVFYYAKAEIVGDKVHVFHPKGVKSAAVRYAWSDAPEDANLFNSAGFPACPFRTDDWQGVTVKGKFE